MREFVDRVHRQPRSALVAQQVAFFLAHIREVYDEMPNMTSHGHRIKHLIAADTQQAMYDSGKALKVTDTFLVVVIDNIGRLQ